MAYDATAYLTKCEAVSSSARSTALKLPATNRVNSISNVTYRFASCAKILLGEIGSGCERLCTHELDTFKSHSQGVRLGHTHWHGRKPLVITDERKKYTILLMHDRKILKL